MAALFKTVPKPTERPGAQLAAAPRRLLGRIRKRGRPNEVGAKKPILHVQSEQPPAPVRGRYRVAIVAGAARLRQACQNPVAQAAIAAGGARVSALRPAGETPLGESLKIAPPALLVFDAELIEIAPRIDAGVVPVVESDAHGVIADRFDRDNADVGAAGNDGFLAGAMPLHLGRRALDAQILGRQAEMAAVLEADLEHLFGPFQAQFERTAGLLGGHGRLVTIAAIVWPFPPRAAALWSADRREFRAVADRSHRALPWPALLSGAHRRRRRAAGPPPPSRRWR